MFRTLASVSAGVLATIAVIGQPSVAAPPDTEPDPGSASFERQLAELGFGTFLSVELGVFPDVFTCTQPRSAQNEDTVTCFALIDGARVVVASTPASESTGRFDFQVVADYAVVDPDSGETETTTAAPESTDAVPVTYSIADRNEANVAILLYGDSINEVAQNEMASVLNAADGTVIAVNTWAWDATSATFTVSFTLNPDSDLAPDVSAWVTVSELSVHWQRGQPFREPAATIRPSLVIVVSGHRFVSSWELTSQVADQAVTQAEWLAAARQS